MVLPWPGSRACKAPSPAAIKAAVRRNQKLRLRAEISSVNLLRGVDCRLACKAGAAEETAGVFGVGEAIAGGATVAAVSDCASAADGSCERDDFAVGSCGGVGGGCAGAAGAAGGGWGLVGGPPGGWGGWAYFWFRRVRSSSRLRTVGRRRRWPRDSAG